MSGIYIKGMEIPKNCFLCQLSYLRENRLYCYQTKDEVIRAKIADNCPLVPVPPHGDLIDKDATMNAILEERGEDTACWFAGRYEPKPHTNYDRIRNMTDEEMAEWAATVANQGGGSCAPGHYDCTGRDNCVECWLDWLKQEAE